MHDVCEHQLRILCVRLLPGDSKGLAGYQVTRLAPKRPSWKWEAPRHRPLGPQLRSLPGERALVTKPCRCCIVNFISPHAVD